MFNEIFVIKNIIDTVQKIIIVFLFKKEQVEAFV